MRKNNLIHKLPAPENRLFWFCVLLLLKFSLLFFLISEDRPSQLPDTIAICSGDCESYLSPIESLISKGTYEPDFRMPGYGIPYLVFRMFADRNLAVNLLIIFQTLVDTLAALLLAIILYRITGRRYGFYLSVLLYGIGVTVSCYNNWILTESMTSSVLILGFYFIFEYIRKKKVSCLVFAGFFLTWSYFLRPVNIFILFIAAFFLFVFFIKENRIGNLIFFLLPAIIINSAWSIRNYITKGKPYLLTENVYIKSWYGDYGLAGLEFCKTFSDFKVTYIFFETRGLIYFGRPVEKVKLEDIKIPEEIYTPDFNYDSLIAIRNLYQERLSPEISPQQSAELERIITQKFKLYTSSIKKHHPFIVYVKTPLVLLKNFIIQAGVHNLYFMPYSYQPFHKKGIKLFFISIYLFSFGLFIAGIIFYKKLFENKFILLAYITAFYIIFIHSIILRSIESRYIVPAYPFFVMAAVFTINTAVNYYNKKRIND